MTLRPCRFGERSSGVLMHLTSLPGPFGSGDLGKSARAFLDVLSRAEQSWWQMLPVSPIGRGFSPYSSDSAFAGEARLVGPDELYQDGLLTKADLNSALLPEAATVDFRKVFACREALLQKAFDRAQAKGLLQRAPFQKFCQDEKYWLNDFCLYRVLSFKHRNTDWTTWDAPFRDRDPGALKKIAQEARNDMQRVAFTQHLFNVGWNRMRRDARALGIGLIGDLPIFVAHGSVDCWAHTNLFQLRKTGEPKVVSGCPPDAFTKDGQLWGHALYDWNAMEDDGFRWWLARIQRTLRQFDAVRLDHFIGFYRYWSVPANAQNARGGRWVRAKGDELFTAAKKQFGSLPFVAEDLGAVIPPVRTLRDRHGFAGMKLLQFGFDDGQEAKHHRPHLLPENSVVYPGTHDNDTSLGWYRGLKKIAKTRGNGAATRALERLEGYLGCPEEKRIAIEMMKAAHHSVAHTSIIPAQDVLGLSTSARMNVPGSAQGNWKWRMTSKDLKHAGWERLASLTTTSDRGR